jgi:hypothetical protein
MPAWKSAAFVNGESRSPNGEVMTKLPIGIGQIDGTPAVSSRLAAAKRQLAAG